MKKTVVMERTKMSQRKWQYQTHQKNTLKEREGDSPHWKGKAESVESWFLAICQGLEKGLGLYPKLFDENKKASAIQMFWIDFFLPF